MELSSGGQSSRNRTCKSKFNNQSAKLSQESFYVGVRLQMQDGWHTYWENPGDSGSPFEAKWNVDEGVIIENVDWPTPQTIPYPPLMTFGYEGDVVFPFQVLSFPRCRAF